MKKRYTTDEQCFATRENGDRCRRRALIGGRGLCSNHVLTDEQWARVDARLAEKQQEKEPEPMTINV